MRCVAHVCTAQADETEASHTEAASTMLLYNIPTRIPVTYHVEKRFYLRPDRYDERYVITQRGIH